PPPAAPPCRPVRARPRRRDGGTARWSNAMARPGPWGRDEASRGERTASRAARQYMESEPARARRGTAPTHGARSPTSHAFLRLQGERVAGGRLAHPVGRVLGADDLACWLACHDVGVERHVGMMTC